MLALRSFLGWRGAVVGVALVLLGSWAVVYTCNTETAACKGAAPWPGMTGWLYGAGWVIAIVGLAVIGAVAVAWIVQAARGG